MYTMKALLWILKILTTVLYTDVHALKNVILTLEPAVVERSQSCTLRCTYDLEGAPLYTVKWYRGTVEFYRYTPSEPQPTKVFKAPGINVDTEQSNITQVVLHNVDFHLSGNFSCEVTTEGGFSTTEGGFSTAEDMQIMRVIQLPESPPTIRVTTEPLDYGDNLSANCMSPPSRPPTILKFTLNNKPVARTDPVVIAKMARQFSWSDLLLNITLTEEYFNGGRLILRCEARIDNIYHKYAELKLNTARDPIPERVSAYDSAAALVFSTSAIYLTTFNYIIFLISN